ncbi:hypothetical protein [Leucobacter massiliensis]|uniref:Gram-positive cocci surface proteins LPxTG domain-containing protein n=1 Tax=Leucobacter massiliensis TaxID=1686285 RepID=A0A2S9QK89_9MICO|nr:hypothetical protein [Leucobacter massiliensis]PRI10003.1 hypothetical protein B4915_13840 [Leucobacter massiliensis]
MPQAPSRAPHRAATLCTIAALTASALAFGAPAAALAQPGGQIRSLEDGQQLLGPVSSRPAFAVAEQTSNVAATTPVRFTVTGLDEVPGDQEFKLLLGAAGGGGWNQLGIVTADQIREDGGTISVPRSALTAGAHYLELSNYDVSTDHYDAKFRIIGSISVADAPAVTPDTVSLDLNGEKPAQLTLRSTRGLPEAQGFELRMLAPGAAEWAPQLQLTAAELALNDGAVTIPRDAFDTEGRYEVRITPMLDEANVLPSDFTLTATVLAGDFSAPTLAKPLTVTYADDTRPVPIRIEGTQRVPGDQMLNVNIRPAGIGAGPSEQWSVSLYELGWADGHLMIPRELLSDPGLYDVEITNWGIESQNYYPELVPLIHQIRVAEEPTISFLDADGVPESSRTVTAGADATVTVAIDGAVSAGSELGLAVESAEGIATTVGPISVPEGDHLGDGNSRHTVSLPAKLFTAQFGEPDTQLTVRAALTLGELPVIDVPQPALLSADTADAREAQEEEPAEPRRVTAALPVTVVAAAPPLALDRGAYTAAVRQAMPFSVLGLDGVPDDLPVTLRLTAHSGEVVWQSTIPAGATRDGATQTVPANTLALTGAESYRLTASVSAFDGEVTSASSPVTVTAAPVAGGPGGPGSQGGLPTTGAGDSAGLAALGLPLLAFGALLMLRARSRRTS